jgi:hypothetical protein
LDPLLELQGNSTRFDSVFVGGWGIDLFVCLFVCMYLGLVVVEDELCCGIVSSSQAAVAVLVTVAGAGAGANLLPLYA